MLVPIFAILEIRLLAAGRLVQNLTLISLQFAFTRQLHLTAPMIKMSEYHLPFHIQEEIMKRLPVNSLVQFRCVSKEWKSLIDSSEFIAAHSLRRHMQPQHLLVWYWDQTHEVRYIWCIDDYTFPQQRSLPTPPLSITQLKLARVVGSSHGLLCVCGYDPDFTTQTAVLWNPSIRKYIGVAVSRKASVGFGVCPVTNDPKIVAITQSDDLKHCEVMIYSLSSGKWNPSINLPTALIQYGPSSVVTDRFMYWIAGLTRDMIMSFDITNDKFNLVDLPDSLARDPCRFMSISKLGESLAILEENRESKSTVVWMMEDGGQSFKKVFTIQIPLNMIVGFRKSGIPIMLLTDDNNESCGFVVYEPNSEHATVLEMCRSPFTFITNSYMESLLFLDRFDFYSY